MRRAYGAVWDMPNPPEGAINLRFQVSGSKWVQLKSLIQSEWKAGATFDTALQLIFAGHYWPLGIGAIYCI